MKTTTAAKGWTAGPWEWACDSYGKVQHSQKYDCVYASVEEAKGTRIVRIASRIENNANARLIAAAPAMYEALKYALECLEELKKDEPSYHFFHYGDVSADEIARAALAQAEGREP